MEVFFRVAIGQRVIGVRRAGVKRCFAGIGFRRITIPFVRRGALRDIPRIGIRVGTRDSLSGKCRRQIRCTRDTRGPKRPGLGDPFPIEDRARIFLVPKPEIDFRVNIEGTGKHRQGDIARRGVRKRLRGEIIIRRDIDRHREIEQRHIGFDARAEHTRTNACAHGQTQVDSRCGDEIERSDVCRRIVLRSRAGRDSGTTFGAREHRHGDDDDGKTRGNIEKGFTVFRRGVTKTVRPRGVVNRRAHRFDEQTSRFRAAIVDAGIGLQFSDGHRRAEQLNGCTARRVAR